MLSGSRKLAAIGALALLVALPGVTAATHAWSTYHWARTSNPFTITVVNSMTSDWDGNLGKAISDWNVSTVLHAVAATGDNSARARKRCAAIAGKVRVCNATYGYNGWLGLAQISVSNSHITQATAKMNDSYLRSGSYTDINRQQVICQEIGHDWGLDHQDTSGADFGTCMDYSNALNNPSPNAGDYDQLLCIYDVGTRGMTLTASPHSCTGTGHLDSSTTIASVLPSAAGSGVGSWNAEFGFMVSRSSDGRTSTFVRDLGAGNQIITHVIWA